MSRSEYSFDCFTCCQEFCLSGSIFFFPLQVHSTSFHPSPQTEVIHIMNSESDFSICLLRVELYFLTHCVHVWMKYTFCVCGGGGGGSVCPRQCWLHRLLFTWIFSLVFWKFLLYQLFCLEKLLIFSTAANDCMQPMCLFSWVDLFMEWLVEGHFSGLTEWLICRWKMLGQCVFCRVWRSCNWLAMLWPWPLTTAPKYWRCLVTEWMR